MVEIIRKEKPHAEHYIEEHLHSAQQVAPSAGAPITLTSGVGVWTLGDFSNDFIANGVVANTFDLHWIAISAADSNVWYEIVLYCGATDIECARVAFGRTAVFTNSISVPVMTVILPAGIRIRAKMMDSAGGSTANIKVFYHTY